MALGQLGDGEPLVELSLHYRQIDGDHVAPPRQLADGGGPERRSHMVRVECARGGIPLPHPLESLKP